MKKLLFTIVFIPFIHLYSAETSKLFLLKSSETNVKAVNISRIAATSVPSFKEKMEKSGWECWDQEHIFPDATDDDLKHLSEYILCRHQMVQEEKKHQALGDTAPFQRTAERKLYHYAIQLPTNELLRLIHNTNSILPAEPVPFGLLNPLIKKASLGELKEYILVRALLEEDCSNIKSKNSCNKKLLQTAIPINGKNESIITCLFAPYVQALDQSTTLPSYRKSLCTMVYAPVVEYLYVGEKIIASLSGTVFSAFPHHNYLLTIHTQKGSQEFKLSQKNLDFHGAGAFANKDESLFVCPYNDPYESGAEGILLVNLNTGKNRMIDCSGKTAACFGNHPYQSIGFGDYNELFSFDRNGKIFIYVPQKDAWQRISEGEWQEISDTKRRGIKGLINDDVNDRFIFWDDKTIFTRPKKSNVKGECLLDLQSNITDVIIDSSGTRLCIKSFCRGSSSEESFATYFLYDFLTQKPIKLLKSHAEKTASSFSPDGNLLIISSCDKGITTHRYFDTNAQIVFERHTGKDFYAHPFWEKQTVGELLAVGNGKSIEQKESFFYYQPQCTTLVDSAMSGALKLLVNEEFDPFVPHPSEITAKLHKRFSQLDQNDNEEYPGEIIKIFSAHKKNDKNEEKQIDNQMILMCRQAFYNHRLAIGGIGLLAVMAYLYGLRVRT